MDRAGDFIAELALDLICAEALDGLGLHDLLLFNAQVKLLVQRVADLLRGDGAEELAVAAGLRRDLP